MKISNDYKCEPSTIGSLFLPFGLWMFAGLDLILLPLFSTQIGRLYFPNDDPTNSILAVYGTFSISLLARVLGGLYFGRLGDIHGRKPVIMVSAWSLTIIMIVSAYLPSNYSNIWTVISPTIIFIITRALIGFFVGGLWPTAAVLAMENLYWIKFKKNKNEIKDFEEEQEHFEQEVKKLTLQSSFLQLGFFLGLFALVFFIITSYAAISEISSYLLPGTLYQIGSEIWRSLSLIGGLMGFLLSIVSAKYLCESKEWIKWKDEWNWKKKKEKQKNGELRDVGIIALFYDKKYRNILFSFWLILSGLMYMYYSTIVIAPEIFKRDNILAGISMHVPEKCDMICQFLKSIGENYLIYLVIMMCIAHIWLGLFCYYGWRNNKTKCITRLLLDRLLSFKAIFHNQLLKLIGMQNDNKVFSEDNRQKELDNLLDVRMIVLIGFMLIPIGIVGAALFIILQPYYDDIIKDNNFGSIAVVVVYTGIVILIANAGWALIPSLLSGGFPIHLRSTGASLAYNGGLLIGFASPFLIMEYYFYFKSEYIIFLPMILGSLSMIIGGLRLMYIVKDEK